MVVVEDRVKIVELNTFSVILRNSELVTIYRKYDEILDSRSGGVQCPSRLGCDAVSPAMRSLQNDSAAILRNVGNRLPNDRNSVTSRKN
jgi:hypothetical protein